MVKKGQTKGRALNPFEAAGGLGGDFGEHLKSTVEKDVLKGGGSDILKQLLGDLGGSKPSKESSSEKPAKNKVIEIFNAAFHGVTQTQEKSAEASHKPKKKETHIEAAMNYSRDIVRSSENASKREVGEMNQNIKQIMSELQRLIHSSKMLQMEFTDVAITQGPVNPGKYDLNFFEWMLVVIRTARQKVEDSGSWLSTVNTKGNKKKGYWGMFKKHGTTFGLSNERAVSTQTG